MGAHLALMRSGAGGLGVDLRVGRGEASSTQAALHGIVGGLLGRRLTAAAVLESGLIMRAATNTGKGAL